MGSRGTEIDGQPTAESTPEDVAVLYSWANLQGAKYRDYSASRREYRAQVRYRAAKALLERELRAQEQAEASAREAEQAARAAEAVARSENGGGGAATHIESKRSAEAAARKAAAERVEAARRAEAVAHAAVLALREEREIAEAHSSARRKELIYEETELRRRQLAGPQPHMARDEALAAPGTEMDNLGGDRAAKLHDSLNLRLQDLTKPSAALLRPAPVEAVREAEPVSNRVDPAGWVRGLDAEAELEPSGPAWLYGSQTPPQARVVQAISQTYKTELAGGDTLQDSRERVASRWFALKGLFENSGPELPAMQPQQAGTARTRLLAVFSLAGGVGKTSLVATLGRVLSSQGEKVLLTDVTPHGLLPVYFGLQEVQPGVACTVSLPGESTAPPISLITCDATWRGEYERQQKAVTEEILRAGQGSQRLLLDIAAGSSWLLREMAGLHPMLLVPLAPDMNSVMSLQAVERLFRGLTDSDGRALVPFYVLNQFDATLPLHLDVREVLRRQLGDRLLRVAIRRSQAVSEALAEGMTVVDYAPDAPVVQDYLEVASWLRSVSPPATEEVRSALRGER